ncbi:hypothetical protein GGI20_004793 [Coemansia sp. BCRC 34301]|nr:hypothetical protein GGI20_004793 [Coemansia sp. BCRC 34301]
MVSAFTAEHPAEPVPKKDPTAKTAQPSRKPATKEQLANFRESFRIFDKDGDGFITEAELAETMAKLGEKLEPKEVKAMFNEADTNQDGTISYDEFVAMMMKDEPVTTTKPLTEEQRAEYAEAFALFDKDNDGSITATELEAVLKSLGQNPSKAEVQDMVNELDTDGNGKIDFEEFIALMQRHSPDESDELKEAFSVFDKDGDGFITEPELAEAMTKLGENIEPKEVKAMFNEADVNQDGAISYNEFVAMMAKDGPAPAA